MENLKKLYANPVKVLKIIGVGIVGLFLLVFVSQFVSSTFGEFTGRVGGFDLLPSAVVRSNVSGGGYGGSVGVSTDSMPYDAGSYQNSYAVEKSSAGSYGAPVLSTRNALNSQVVVPAQAVPGSNAEDFEVTNYSANIETRILNDTCGKIAELKKLDYVVFENSNNYQTGCNFSFKVKHENVQSVLDVIKSLNPKELNDNTYTIKQQVDDFTNETDLLLKKRDSIDDTLKTAINAYNEITVLATKTQNADALAQIINSKIGIIERLTQEKVNINTQLDNITRAKSLELDKLVYTYFNVNVVENKFVDFQRIGDSWKNSLKNFVWQVNTIVQELTLNFVLFFLMVFEWLLYAVVLLVLAKYGWRYAKYFWNK